MAHNFVNVWTDGSYKPENNGTGGRGVFFGDNHRLNVAERADGSPTSGKAEIQAARRAVEIAKREGVKNLRVHSDSQEVVTGMNENMAVWKANNWTNFEGHQVVNKTEFERLNRQLDGSINVEFVKVSRGTREMKEADKLANKGAQLR
ncbi:ribonuclease H1-like [Phlebotomus argentipes]|uniref:ribonuclease H1-like n=1 Tax=Phlebotomus argentipes TaxID=94469 RepID=UPI0028931521|nr:ribonuclease H1-like [Phlebotomus argentipes]